MFVSFAIGDKLFDSSCVPEGMDNEQDDCGFIKAVETMKFVDRGGITISNLEQAKQAAKNFAEYVG